MKAHLGIIVHWLRGIVVNRLQNSGQEKVIKLG